MSTAAAGPVPRRRCRRCCGGGRCCCSACRRCGHCCRCGRPCRRGRSARCGGVTRRRRRPARLSVDLRLFAIVRGFQPAHAAQRAFGPVRPEPAITRAVPPDPRCPGSRRVQFAGREGCPSGNALALFCLRALRAAGRRARDPCTPHSSARRTPRAHIVGFKRPSLHLAIPPISCRREGRFRGRTSFLRSWQPIDRLMRECRAPRKAAGGVSE